MSVGTIGNTNDEFNRAMQALLAENPPQSSNALDNALRFSPKPHPVFMYQPTWWHYCLFGVGTIFTLAGIGYFSRLMGWVKRSRALAPNVTEYCGDLNKLFEQISDEQESTPDKSNLVKVFGEDHNQDREDVVQIGQAFGNSIHVYLIEPHRSIPKEHTWLFFNYGTDKPISLESGASATQTIATIRQLTMKGSRSKLFQSS